MTFYEAPGRLLVEAGALLAETPPSPDVVAQLRPLSLQLARLGAIWPHLFETLGRETEVLLATRAELRGNLEAAGVLADSPFATDLPDEPVARYGQLVRELNEVVPLLHAHRHETWGGRALATLRRGLAEAGRIQLAMVERAWNR
jgi:hypothetical protein